MPPRSGGKVLQGKCSHQGQMSATQIELRNSISASAKICTIFPGAPQHALELCSGSIPAALARYFRPTASGRKADLGAGFPGKLQRVAAAATLERSPPLRLELLHVLHQPPHALDRHGVVDRRAHAADSAVAFDLDHAARFRAFEELAVELRIRQGERDVHARAVRLPYRVFEKGAGVEEVVEELRLGD